MKSKNILSVVLTVVIASGIIIGSAYAVKKWSNQPEPNNNTSSAWQDPVENHIKDNISDLSPEKAVLGGNFYVTDISFPDASSALVDYEDGHKAYRARVKFTVTPPEEVNITSFEIIEGVDEEAEKINFSETGNLTQKDNDNWQLVYEKPGQPALTAELNFTEDSKCITTTGENGENRQENLCLESSWEQGARAVVNGVQKNGTVEVVAINFME